MWRVDLELQESLLVVEDRALDREAIRRHAEVLGLQCAFAKDAAEALHFVQERAPFDYALVDLHLGNEDEGQSGLSLISALRAQTAELGIVAVSADPRLTTWLEAERAGASLFLRKPVLSTEELAVALETVAQKRWYSSGKESVFDHSTFPPALLQECPLGIVLDQAKVSLLQKLAKGPSMPLVVCGESGTGRDEVAHLLHRLRLQQSDKIPFVKIDCSQGNAETLGRRLFGYVPSSASEGTSLSSFGALALALGGILYLDHIDKAPAEVQEELARVVAEGMYDRRGDGKSMFSSFQLVCSCTTSTDKAVSLGNLVPSLRTQLLGAEIRLLPLRLRTFEMRTLVRVFFARRGQSASDSLVAEVAERCRRYHWQGNIRELYSILNLFLMLNDQGSSRLDFERFPEVATMFPPAELKEPPVELEDVYEAPDVPSEDAVHPVASGAVYSHPALLLLADALNRDVPLYEVISSLEKQLLGEAIRRHGMNMSHVCAALRMPRSTLNLKRRQHGLP
jgi:DNA-binding NtrC family response regulator